jgi:hypothetical protein
MSVLYPPLKKSRPFGLHAREGGQLKVVYCHTRRCASRRSCRKRGGYEAKAEKWDTDSDSNESDEEDLKQ